MIYWGNSSQLTFIYFRGVAQLPTSMVYQWIPQYWLIIDRYKIPQSLEWRGSVDGFLWVINLIIYVYKLNYHHLPSMVYKFNSTFIGAYDNR